MDKLYILVFLAVFLSFIARMFYFALGWAWY